MKESEVQCWEMRGSDVCCTQLLMHHPHCGGTRAGVTFEVRASSPLLQCVHQMCPAKFGSRLN